MDELITTSNGIASLAHETASRIAEFERAVKSIREKEDALKTAIMAEMEKRGIVKLESPELVISYIAACDRETFDGKAFRSVHPEMYDEFVRLTPVKPSIRIKLKDGN